VPQRRADTAGSAGSTAATGSSLPRLRGPVVVLGVGLGGFFDGIVFHQVLQLHHMLSNTDSDRLGLTEYPVGTVEGLQVNTLWDGLFHVTTYVLVLVGLFWLWRRYQEVQPGRPPFRLLLGGLLAGWGLFNLVEGVVNHHLLAIHRVYDTGEAGPALLWDLLFLAAGAVLLVGGWLLMGRATVPGERRSGSRR
jgi:uncharacterized membrane protein